MNPLDVAPLVAGAFGLVLAFITYRYVVAQPSGTGVMIDIADTSGPSMNILIKLMSVVSLVIAPLLR